MNDSCLAKAQGRPRPNPWYGHTTNTHPPPCHIPGSQAMSPSLPLLCPSLVFSYSLPPTPRLICYQCICRKFRIRGVDNLIFKRFFRLTAKTQGYICSPVEISPSPYKIGGNWLRIRGRHQIWMWFKLRAGPILPIKRKGPYKALWWRHFVKMTSCDIIGGKALGNRYS